MIVSETQAGQAGSIQVPPIGLGCPVCYEKALDSTGGVLLSDRRKGLPGVWRVAECQKCTVISMVPLPTDDQLASYYDAYSQDSQIDLSQRAGSRYSNLRKLFHWVSGDVDPRDFVEVPSGARVLDYGCGHAGYLSDFHHRGVAISGAEIAAYAVEACRKHGYDVRKVEDFSRIPFPSGEFDIVYLMQVFEHLRDPHGFFQELSRILRNGGMLYLAMPNAASIWRKVFGCNWVSGWFAPFHLFHYTRDAMKKLANQYGFDLLLAWSRTPESWFRLNLKAALYSKEFRLDWHRNWLDATSMRYLLMFLLRMIESPFREKDCLVLQFRKR
ncbi:MAG: class I SAM-dependent methyltransferase [Nitrospira sp.]|nr:class I SAM-dependent methyltransferase [Nitrospira sp.]MBL8053519.1 class I SAM-dependent methyltransferase [Nitrospira sp.]